MSFLNQLKDIGFGNRGPYGRMKSGASYLSETIEDRLGKETDKGVNSAIAAAAAKGPITPETQIEIADRWGVPLNEMIKMTQPINEELETKRLTNLSKSLYLRMTSWAEEHPGAQPKQKDILGWIKEGKGTEDDLSFAMGVLQKIIKAKDVEDFTLKSDEKRFRSIGGGPAQVIAANLKTEKPKYSSATIYGPDGQTKKVPIKEGVEYTPPKGWSLTAPSTSPDSAAKDIASDIRSASQQLKTLQSGVNMQKDILWTPTHLAAIRDSKKELMTMVKEYEDIHGPGSAKRVGFDSSITKPQKITPEIAAAYLEEAGGDKIKAREMAKIDGYIF